MVRDPPYVIESPLLRTKITIPPLPRGYIPRPRLTEIIERGAKGPLTLLSAPAGYGKTNLLIEWARSTRLRVAWITFDSADNDQDRMFRYVIAALQTLQPHLGDEALDFIQTVKGNGTYTHTAIEIGLAQLINELTILSKELVLVVDDFQAIEDPIKLESTSNFLKHLPGNMHLVIASRSEPPIDLAYLRGKGRVTEIGADELRFNGEEVGAFFEKAVGKKLLQETIQALENRTVGWVTALQMAALSLRNQPDPGMLLTNQKGDTHQLMGFLAEEVLDRQPEEVRQFLLRSSVLDTLSGPLCEAVVNPDAQPGYGAVMLNRLEQARLFITALDERHELFRYHNLFLEFLRHIQAEINPAEIPVLHKRAALWLEQNGNLENAFRHALASGDTGWAADLIQRNCEAMIKNGEVASLTHWIGQLPDSFIHLRPPLSIAYAWGLIASYRLDLARYWLDDLRTQQSELEEQPAIGSYPEEIKAGLWNIQGGLALCQSTLALLGGDWEQAAEFSRQATQYLHEENPFIQSMIALDESLYFLLSGDTVKTIESLRSTARIARQANNLLVMVLATCQLADIQALQGKLSQAWVTLQKAQLMSVRPNGQPLPLAGLVDVGMGEVLIERYQVDEAKSYLERGMKTAGTMWMLSNLDGMISLARIRQIHGDIAGSQAVIEEAMRLALSNESGQWDVTYVSAMAVRLALMRGDLPEAFQWWNRGEFPDFLAAIPLRDYPYHLYENLVITQAGLLIAMGRSQGNESYLRQCAELLEPLLQEAKRFQRVASVIEIMVLQAMVQYSLGEIEPAARTFRNALALSEPEGFRRVYLYGSLPYGELLDICLSEPPESGSLLPTTAYMESLRDAIKSEVQPEPQPLPGSHIASGTFTSKTEDGLPITLSSREVEVLKLIAEGKSNQEISAELYLALNTVKRHAYNIYAKLGVQKRTQAVSIARKLGLIP